MKALALRSFGGPEVLKVEELPRPQPSEDQVLVRVIAAAINPVDAAVRRGMFKQMTGENFPLVGGSDISGVVEKAGAKITQVKPGDAVYAYLSVRNGGGYSEYAIARPNEMARKPQSLTFAEAAAVPLAATTAWEALVDNAHLTSGQTVLIHGGSGGVGSFAVQIAKARGAKVIATASTANQDVLKQLGVDQPIDYTATKFEDVVNDADLVLDCVGRETLTRSYGVVKKGGILVSIAGRPDPAECEKRGIRGTSFMAEPRAEVLNELTALIDAKKIKPVVARTVSLAEAAQAQEEVAARHTRGKVVIRIAEEPTR